MALKLSWEKKMADQLAPEIHAPPIIKSLSDRFELHSLICWQQMLVNS